MIGGRVSDNIKGDSLMQQYFSLMRKAYEVLKSDNDTKANGIWFWGASYAPSFGEQAGGSRIVLAETPLMRGIAVMTGAECATTPEDGGFVQFLKDKKEKAVAAVSEYDFAYIHIQKLDDLSHELLPIEKMRAIEDIDRYFIRPFFEEITGPFSAVVASDHYTFSDSGGHGGEPAPFMLTGHGTDSLQGRFTEQHCRDAGRSVTAPELVALQREEEE
jgi:2,3-bisphosphoglycerate-independent phosphoglycerate mutase